MIGATRQLVVGVADCRVTRDPDSTIVTYALGSCIAVVIHDPMTRVGGMLHLMLPHSSLDPIKAERNPWMFADTGIPLLLKNAYRAGAEKTRLLIRVAGGSQVVGEAGRFNIGKRNQLAVRDILRREGIGIHGESTGGNGSRTVRLDVGSGRLLLRNPDGSETDL